MGFAAVPALIEHLNDDRLTRRSVVQGINKTPTSHQRVGEVVIDLLQELAGDELGKNWLQRRRGYVIEKSDAMAWWNKARQEGEQAYFERHVLPESGSTAVRPTN